MTIYALSSGKGRAGVSVIRVSGDKVVDVIKSLTTKNTEPKPRLASLSKFYHPVDKRVLDYGLYLYFKAPHSFTGEDVVEFQIHGGRAVVACRKTGPMRRLNRMPLAGLAVRTGMSIWPCHCAGTCSGIGISRLDGSATPGLIATRWR